MGVDSTTASATWANGRLRSDYDYRKEPIYDELHAAFRIVGEELGIRIAYARGSRSAPTWAAAPASAPTLRRA